MVEYIFNNTDNTLLCVLSGRMGTEVNELFSVKLNEKILDCRTSMDKEAVLKVCFDLKNVTFIASSFIRTCIMVSRQVTDGNFCITNASPVIKKTFKIAGLDDLLNVT